MRMRRSLSTRTRARSKWKRLRKSSLPPSSRRLSPPLRRLKLRSRRLPSSLRNRRQPSPSRQLRLFHLFRRPLPRQLNLPRLPQSSRSPKRGRNVHRPRQCRWLRAPACHLDLPREDRDRAGPPRVDRQLPLRRPQRPHGRPLPLRPPFPLALRQPRRRPGLRLRRLRSRGTTTSRRPARLNGGRHDLK